MAALLLVSLFFQAGPVWEKSSPSGNPVAQTDQFVILNEKESLTAFRLSDGNQVWKTQVDAATFTRSGGLLVCEPATSKKVIVLLRLSDGKKLDVQLSPYSWISSGVALYTTSSGKGLSRLDENGNVEWKINCGRVLTLEELGDLIVFSHDGQLEARDTAGKKLWIIQERFGRVWITSSHVVCFKRDSETKKYSFATIDPETGKVLKTIKPPADFSLVGESVTWKDYIAMWRTFTKTTTKKNTTSMLTTSRAYVLNAKKGRMWLVSNSSTQKPLAVADDYAVFDTGSAHVEKTKELLLSFNAKRGSKKWAVSKPDGLPDPIGCTGGTIAYLDVDRRRKMMVVMIRKATGTGARSIKVGDGHWIKKWITKGGASIELVSFGDCFLLHIDEKLHVLRADGKITHQINVTISDTINWAVRSGKYGLVSVGRKLCAFKLE